MLWLVSRAADGLDGPLARRRRARGVGDAGAGGFFDITADFTVYGATVVGVAIGSGGPLWPFLLVLLAYYVNGAAFLAFSSIAERSGRTLDDGRSLSFLGRIAEGTETIVVHTLWLLLPLGGAADRRGVGGRRRGERGAADGRRVPGPALSHSFRVTSSGACCRRASPPWSRPRPRRPRTTAAAAARAGCA